jgi:hypothetical protein
MGEASLLFVEGRSRGDVITFLVLEYGLGVLDSPSEVTGAALHYLNLKPTSEDLGDLAKATALLQSIRLPFATPIRRNTSMIKGPRPEVEAHHSGNPALIRFSRKWSRSDAFL